MESTSIGFAEIIEHVIASGPAKWVYDAAIWAFLVIRLTHFARSLDDWVSRDIYLAVLFSAAYASSVGSPIDLVIGHYDTEFRVLAAIAGAFSMLEAVRGMWASLDQECRLFGGAITLRSLRQLNLRMLALSVMSFVVLEYGLGRPAVLGLQTETFNFAGNPFLPGGRILARVYIVFASVMAIVLLLRLISSVFADDPRLRLRAWSAVAAIATVGLHYVNVMAASLVVAINEQLAEVVQSTYDQVALVLVVSSAAAMGILGSPRLVLDVLIVGRYRLRARLLRHRLRGLRLLLEGALTRSGEPYAVPAETMPPLPLELIRLIDARRLVLAFLDDAAVERALADAIKTLPAIGPAQQIWTEAVLLRSGLAQLKEGATPRAIPSSRIPEPTARTMEDLAMFYGSVAGALCGGGISPSASQGADGEQAVRLVGRSTH
jgi:hypothetical protein